MAEGVIGCFITSLILKFNHVRSTSITPKHLNFKRLDLQSHCSLCIIKPVYLGRDEITLSYIKII